MKTILTISILLSCLCGKGQTYTKEQYQKQLDRLNALDTLPAIKADSPFNPIPGIAYWHFDDNTLHIPPPVWHFENNALDILQSQITHLQQQVDSLIEAMRPKASHNVSLPYFFIGEESGTLRIDSVPTFTAYLIDTRAHTIAIDHRTKLPSVAPKNPKEGDLVKDKWGQYCYFDGKRWVLLKEVK